MNEYMDYVVLVNFKGEAISLDASTEDEAIARAREVITAQYGKGVASDASYSVEGEGER
jgi:hypothetical protein